MVTMPQTCGKSQVQKILEMLIIFLKIHKISYMLCQFHSKWLIITYFFLS